MARPESGLPGGMIVSLAVRVMLFFRPWGDPEARRDLSDSLGPPFRSLVLRDMLKPAAICPCS
jgi:hypothetical protein